MAHFYTNRCPTRYREIDFDFYKFIGHELFVTFISFFVKQERWSIIAKVLDETIYVENPDIGDMQLVSFGYTSISIDILRYRNNRLNLNRSSLHADFLRERHSDGELGRLVPIQQFIDADCFLFFRAEIQGKYTRSIQAWYPRSAVAIKNTPRYLIQSYEAKYASKLLGAFCASSIENFRDGMIEACTTFRKIVSQYFPSDVLRSFDPSRIGTMQ